MLRLDVLFLKNFYRLPKFINWYWFISRLIPKFEKTYIKPKMTEYPNYTLQLNTTLETILGADESGYVFRILSPIIMVPFGLLGNTMILFILMQKRYTRVSTFYYMKALAVSDNIVMAMFFVRWLNKLPNSVIEHDKWFCMFYFFFIRLGFGISAWTLLLMSLDR